MSIALRLCLASLVLTAGCKEVTCAIDPALGQYTLVSLDGNGVPALLPGTPQTVGDTVMLESGTVSLVGATYTIQLTLQLSGHEQGPSAIEDTGTYSVNGDTITFTSSSGRQVTGTLLSGGLMAALTDATYGTLSMMFSKQSSSHAC